MNNLDTVSGSVKAIGLRQHELAKYIMESGFTKLIVEQETNRHDYLLSLLKAIIEKDICKRYKVRY